MNLGTLMIQNNYSAEFFSFESEGTQFSIVAKQTPGNCRTGRVSILLKCKGEKPHTLTVLADQFTIENAIDFVKTECLSVSA